MTMRALAVDLRKTTIPAPSAGDFGPRWGLLAIWAAFAVVAAGGLGASLALPNPALQRITPAVERATPAVGVLAVRAMRLKAKLAINGNDGDGWFLLAHTQSQLRQYRDAETTYRQAASYLTADATLLAEWAEAHLLAQQRQWDNEARSLLKRALAADSRHVKALALAGSEAFDRHDYALAIEFWERMKTAAPAGSMEMRLAEVSIAEAKQLRSGKP